VIIGQAFFVVMPLLSKGSTYTGLDKGDVQLAEARETFENAPFPAEFGTV